MMQDYILIKTCMLLVTSIALILSHHQDWTMCLFLLYSERDLHLVLKFVRFIYVLE